jgi:hypothetical protein
LKIHLVRYVLNVGAQNEAVTVCLADPMTDMDKQKKQLDREARQKRFEEAKAIAKRILERYQQDYIEWSKKPMPLDNVVWHDHFFPDIESQNEGETIGRFDACELDKPHRFVVYAAEHDMIVCEAMNKAWSIKIAQALAKAYGSV